MATTKIFPIHEDVDGSLAYIANPEKTDDGRLVYAFGCSEKPSRAARDFSEIRSRRSTVLAQHFIVSFKPGEITPERALEVGKEICQKLLDDQYQFLLTVHVDKQHTHLHCVFNNTNLINGHTFQTLNNQGKVSERMWKKLRDTSDEMCKRHHLNVIQHPEMGKGKSRWEWDMSRQGLSWKAKLKYAIDQVVKESENFDDFLAKQFVIIGEFFGTSSIIKKANDDLIAYVNENMGSSEADLDYCKALLGQKLSEIGLSKESAAPVYAVLQARADQLDLEYRTVEGVVFNSRNEADVAKESVTANEGVLKKDCSEFITRSEYVNHVNIIRALPIPQAISTIYAMQYEQKLKEFDKKCKLAVLYEEANSGEKRSIKSRLSSLTSSSAAQRSAWEEVTRNGQYKLSDITAGAPDEKGIANIATDFGKTAAGKLKGLFGKK